MRRCGEPEEVDFDRFEIDVSLVVETGWDGEIVIGVDVKRGVDSG